MSELLSEEDFIELLDASIRLNREGNLVKRDWDGGFVVVGDTHGHLSSTEAMLELSKDLDIPIAFLGDYVDRGPKQLENLCAILQRKMDDVENTIVLRGNHEDLWINDNYGFFSVLKEHYSEEVFEHLGKLYSTLPIAALVSEYYFLVHGGISEYVLDIGQIRKLKPHEYSYNEFLWNDPSEDIDLFSPNDMRGLYSMFGKTALERFMDRNGIEKMIRSHTCYPEGYSWHFEGKLLTVFSAPDYCYNTKAYYALAKNGDVGAHPMMD